MKRSKMAVSEEVEISGNKAGSSPFAEGSSAAFLEMSTLQVKAYDSVPTDLPANLLGGLGAYSGGLFPPPVAASIQPGCVLLTVDSVSTSKERKSRDAMEALRGFTSAIPSQWASTREFSLWRNGTCEALVRRGGKAKALGPGAASRGVGEGSIHAFRIRSQCVLPAAVAGSASATPFSFVVETTLSVGQRLAWRHGGSCGAVTLQEAVDGSQRLGFTLPLEALGDGESTFMVIVQAKNEENTHTLTHLCIYWCKKREKK
jgi:hypothetical protein